jgi:hypothetical protein
MENFWEDIWDIKIRLFGYPTIGELIKAYTDGTLPKKEMYACRHRHLVIPSIWIPYSQLEPMKKMEEDYQIRLAAFMWGVKPESVRLRMKKLNQEDYI